MAPSGRLKRKQTTCTIRITRPQEGSSLRWHLPPVTSNSKSSSLFHDVELLPWVRSSLPSIGLEISARDATDMLATTASRSTSTRRSVMTAGCSASMASHNFVAKSATTCATAWCRGVAKTDMNPPTATLNNSLGAVASSMPRVVHSSHSASSQMYLPTVTSSIFTEVLPPKTETEPGRMTSYSRVPPMTMYMKPAHMLAWNTCSPGATAMWVTAAAQRCATSVSSTSLQARRMSWP
mmetsp:Transcript_4332/g.10443  ORF Transcript_4332/g.10443 Transcript_4332/m.10443 type:complete len:237 (+) Transcript_4332:220-930(+)